MDERGPKHRLKVTAGPGYDPQTHQVVYVNDEKTLRFENEHSRVSICVRIQDYVGSFVIRCWNFFFFFFYYLKKKKKKK